MPLRELYKAIDGKIDLRATRPDVIEKVLIPIKDSVIAWLNSNEFKAKYQNHPYAPMIDPSTVNYDNTQAELAWELNLPLPPYFDFAYISSHGQGSSGFWGFLKMLGSPNIGADAINDARSAYIISYNNLITHKKLRAKNKHISPPPPLFWL